MWLLRVKLGCGLRLTGLAWQGSIPCACVGFGALCVAAVSRILLNREVKEGAMATERSEFRSAFAVSLLDVISDTGAGCAAGALLT
jgi:hypothetical protein